MNPQTKTLNADQLAKFLGISRRRLDGMRRHPRFPKPMPLPGHPIWSTAVVEQFLSAGASK
jgi:predicted DNA-binding transcriptional regulator AlpA